MVERRQLERRAVTNGGSNGALRPQNQINQAALAYLDRAIKYKGDLCILWPFAKTPAGYGEIRLAAGEPQRYVHRVICERIHGRPPTEKHEVAHKCGNGHLSCITPKHMRWATRAENMDEKYKHGRQHRLTNRSALTSAEISQIKQLRGQLTQQAIAARFGIARRTVCDIQLDRRQPWRGSDGA